MIAKHLGILVARLLFVIFAAMFVWSIGFLFGHHHPIIGAFFAAWGSAVVIIAGFWIFSWRSN